MSAWTRAALHPPRAHGAPLPPAELKATPEDFHVLPRDRLGGCQVATENRLRHLTAQAGG